MDKSLLQHDRDGVPTHHLKQMRCEENRTHTLVYENNKLIQKYPKTKEEIEFWDWQQEFFSRQIDNK